MKRRSYFIGLILLGVTSILSAQPVAAWNTVLPYDAPGGVLRMRVGSDGNTTYMPMKAYYTTQYSNPTITLHRIDCQGNSRFVIWLNNQTWRCNQGTQTITLPTPQWDSSVNMYKSDATLQLINLNTNNCGSNCIDYKFWAQLNNGADSKLTLDTSTNHNGLSMWGYSGTYNITFGPPPSYCGAGAVAARVGVWDPDNYSHTIRLYRLINGGWVNVTGQGYSPQNVGGNGYLNADQFHVDFSGGGGRIESTFAYNFQPQQQYLLTINTTAGNTVVPIWPFPTIYGDIVPLCPYTLTPTMTAPTNSSITPPGGSIAPRAQVNNNAGDSRSTEWRITRWVYAPGSVPDRSGGDSSSDPCPYFAAKNPGRVLLNPCSTFDSGGRVFNNGNSPLLGSNNDTLNYPLGSRVCYAASVRPYREVGNDWRHSTMVCTMIAKSPKLHVTGGDLHSLNAAYATWNWDSGTSGYFGSWVEYGVFTAGPNGQSGGQERIASSRPPSSQYAFIANSPPPHEGDRLSFGNTAGHGQGNFTAAGVSSTGLESNFTSAPSGAITAGCTALRLTGILPVTPGLHYCDYGATPITLAANPVPLPAGTSVVIRTNGTVRIDGNLSYSPGPYTNVRDLPQLVISARRIHIRSNVTTVDAWLVTSGGANEIDTCYYEGPSAPDGHTNSGQVSANRCAQALTINGPVETDRFRSFRTAGADTSTRSDPAEVINFRPDAYLWLYQYLHSSGAKFRTTAAHELPPRY